MSVEIIARRYAAALADVVVPSGEAETVKAELAVWNAMIDANGDLTALLANPSVAHAGKTRVVDDLIARTKPSRTTANFLSILLENGRLTELGHIYTKFTSILEERAGVVAAEVISARELPDAERVEFEKQLAKLTGKQVRFNFAVDPDLIGGVVTRIGSTVYDGSVRAKLETLKTELIGAK